MIDLVVRLGFVNEFASHVSTFKHRNMASGLLALGSVFATFGEPVSSRGESVTTHLATNILVSHLSAKAICLFDSPSESKKK